MRNAVAKNSNTPLPLVASLEQDERLVFKSIISKNPTLMQEAVSILRSKPKNPYSEQFETDRMVEQHIAVIILTTSGATKNAMMRTLNIGADKLHKWVWSAKLFLHRGLGLSDYEADAIISPRLSGHPGEEWSGLRYSVGGTSIERIRSLARFEKVANEVSWAQSDLQIDGFDDIIRWQSGWRPAHHWLSNETRDAVHRMIDADDCLTIWPSGFRLGSMVGAVEEIEVRTRLDECESAMLCVWPIQDVKDPMSSSVVHRGCGIAVPLCEVTQTRWQTFLQNRVRKTNNLRFRLVHLPNPSPSLDFVA